MKIITNRCSPFASSKYGSYVNKIKLNNIFSLILFFLFSSSTILGQNLYKTIDNLESDKNKSWASANSPRKAIQVDYEKYSRQDNLIIKESSLKINLDRLQLIGAGTPCTAHRWTSGDGWRQNTADNTTVNKWEAITLPAPKLQPKGVVRCASSAETEEGLDAYKGTYDIASNPIAAVLPQTDCFSMKSEEFGKKLSAPTQGEDIVWLNFDIKPLAGTYQFQIVSNQKVGFVLFYVDPAQAGPIDGVTPGTKYPVPDNGLSGNCNNLKFATFDIGGVAHPACGISGNGWTTITVPSFRKPTNYYLAMWLADPDKTTFPKSMNLLYKARHGCGGATCTLEHEDKKITCNNNGTYSVCLNYAGSAGRWAIKDETGLASSISYTTYLQNGTTVVNTGTSPMTLGTIPDGAVFGTICATYPIGTPYDISLTPDPTYKPNKNYVQCADGDRQKGSSAVTATLAVDVSPHCTIPVIGEGCIDITSAAHSANLMVTSALPGGVGAYTYNWVIQGPSTGVLTNATSATATYKAGVGDAGLDVVFKVTATPKDASVCAQTATVIVHVSTLGVCTVTGLSPVCANSTNTYTGAPNPVPSGATYNWVLTGVGGSGTTDATFATANGNGTIDVKAGSQGYRITLNQVYGNPDLSGNCFKDVSVTNIQINAGEDFTKTCTLNPNGKQIGETPVTGFTYSWSPITGLDNPNIGNPTANPSVTTTYTVTKTNTASGCFGKDDVVVTVNNTPVEVNAGADFTKTCIAYVNGKQIGETPVDGFKYSWSPITGLSNAYIANPIANPWVTTTYTVTKTNLITGCKQTDQVVVWVKNAAIVVSNIITNATCYGASNGTAKLTFSGGTEPYLVSFNGSAFVAQTSPKLYTGLRAGIYNYIVKDANGCQKSGSVCINHPYLLTCYLKTPLTQPFTNTAGNIITGSVTGGTAPYNISAYFDATGKNAGWLVTKSIVTGSIINVTYTSGSPISSSVLTVIITDCNGCKTTCCVTLGCRSSVSQKFSSKSELSFDMPDIIAKEMNVSAYPNPFSSVINFNFTTPVSGKVNLELFDIQGKRMAIVYTGWMDANIARTATYNVPATLKTPIIYNFTSGNKTITGRLLPGDRNYKNY